jgi:hypothetical protein
MMENTCITYNLRILLIALVSIYGLIFWKCYQMYRKYIKNIILFFYENVYPYSWRHFYVHWYTTISLCILSYIHWYIYCTVSTSRHTTLRITLSHYASHTHNFDTNKNIIYKITQSHYKPHTTVLQINFFSKLQDNIFTRNFIFNLIDRC